MTSPQRRIALLIEYDGTPYVGAQLQSNGPSIQSELERAIQQMTSSFTRISFAGRTDAGVHALGQVAVFDTPTNYTPEEFVGGINARLPETISLRAAREVEAGFDPRRRAVARRYRYSIVCTRTRRPLVRNRMWQVTSELNLRSMREAAALLIGEHDFSAFASPEASRGSTRREIFDVRLRCCRQEIAIDIEANAFLMHQVRRTAAALVDVGSEKLSVAEFSRHLREKQAGSYERAAPPSGLCLLCVKYQPPLFGIEREQWQDDEDI